MSPHVDRMHVERDELDTRINSLDAFINSNPVFEDLPDDKKDLMQAQLHAMRTYSAILSMRIVVELAS